MKDKKDWGRDCPLERGWKMWKLAEKSFWAVKPVFLSGETNPLVQQGCKFPVLFWVTVSSKEVIKTEGAVML